MVYKIQPMWSTYKNNCRSCYNGICRRKWKISMFKIIKKANISNNIYYYKHKFNIISQFIHKLDDICYLLGLPNIIIVIIIFTIFNIIFL